MEWVFTAFIFFGVIAVTALLFGGWVVFTIVRLILRGISALFDAPAPPQRTLAQSAPAQGARCGNPKCLTTNPTTAQFCRRCGSAMPQAQRVAVRRAAMW
jgi:hypothetical protein